MCLYGCGTVLRKRHLSITRIHTSTHTHTHRKRTYTHTFTSPINEYFVKRPGVTECSFFYYCAFSNFFPSTFGNGCFIPLFCCAPLMTRSTCVPRSHDSGLSNKECCVECVAIGVGFENERRAWCVNKRSVFGGLVEAHGRPNRLVFRSVPFFPLL